VPPDEITSYFGVPASDGGAPNSNDYAVDIKYRFLSSSKEISPDGDELTLPASPDAAYSGHSLAFPPGSVSPGIRFSFLPPIGDLFVPNAVEVGSDSPTPDFLGPAILTLEFKDSDVDAAMGDIPAAFRINQLIGFEKQAPVWVPVPGEQTIDPENHTISVAINSLNPAGAPAGKKPYLKNGNSGIFGNLPGETIEENSIYIRAEEGGSAKILVPPSLRPGTNCFYTLHEVEFPGYVTTDSSDPSHIKVAISQATLLDRTSLTGGNSFPVSSASIFVIKTQNASASPVAFTDPVNLTVQFMDGSENAFNDIVQFSGDAGEVCGMALVKDVFEGMGVDFQFVGGIVQSIHSATGGGYVEASAVPNLTDSTGKGTWGTVSHPPLPKHLWMFY